MDGFGPSFNLGRGFPAEDDRDFPQFHSRHPDSMRSHSPRPSSDEAPHKTSRVESIPIRVVHEKNPADTASPKAKHPAMSRNTTELPAKGTNSNQPERSPRIARASSEPPKTFQKHLSQMKQPSNHQYSSIPEGGIPPSDAQTHQLNVPSASGGNNNPNNLATSASAPSVPTSSQQEAPNHLKRSEIPPPPPRGVSPKPTGGAETRKQSAPPTMMGTPPGVRHIPIFVEGRDEPVVNRSASVGGPSAASGRAGGFVKPSDYYPNGTQKVSRGEVHPQRMHMNLPTQEQQRQVPVRSNEPTSPVSPPPGPIPMGWVPPSSSLPPQKVVPGDSTSPLPAPEGPIPLPCSPNFYNPSSKESNALGQDQVDSVASASPRAERKQTMVPPPKNPVPNVSQPGSQSGNETTDPPSQAPQEKGGGPDDPALSKMEKIQAEVSALVKKIEEFKGNKKDKEYLYLDEMLTRHLIALDEIDTGGRNELRQMRKESIKSINRCLSMLDSRAKNESAKGNTNNNNNEKKPTNESDAAETNNQILSDLAALSTTVSANKVDGASETTKKD